MSSSVAQALRGRAQADAVTDEPPAAASGVSKSKKASVAIIGGVLLAASATVGHYALDGLDRAQAARNFAQAETVRLQALADMRVELARLSEESHVLMISPTAETVRLKEVFQRFQQRYTAYLREANYSAYSAEGRALHSSQAWLMEYDTRIDALMANVDANADIPKDITNVIELMDKPLNELVNETRRQQIAQLSALQSDMHADRGALLSFGGFALLVAAFCWYRILKMLDDAQSASSTVAAEKKAVEAVPQESQNARNQFIGQISHELATPLQTISTSIEMLEDSPTLVSVNDKRQIDRMALACRTMQNYVKDMKDFARLKAGKLELRKEEFNPSNLLEDIAAEHTAAAKAKGLEILLNFEPRDRDLLVTADPYRFQQVVNNLLSNAIKYTESGQIRCWLHLETSDPPTLHLKIHDTGTGVESAAVGRIFEPFTQEDHSPVPAGGIGMGLAIVKEIVDWQGGEFGIESALDSGTRFRIRLPVEIRRPELRTHPAVRPEIRETRRVLLVDDNIAILGSLRDLVESCGYACDEAGGGREALMKVHQEAYAAVLLDINMPDINGYEVAEAIRSRIGPNQKIPIFAVTGNLINQVTPEQTHLFTEILRKPVNRQEVSDALQAHIAPVHA